MKAYKGFDKDLKCKDFQYEIGKTYEQDKKPKCCENGFHSCEYPLDIFNYYAPGDSRYCEVEIDGEMDKKGDDSKIASSKISIGLEIGIKGIVDGAIKFIFDKVDWNKAKKSNTKDQSAATNTGYQSAATNTGNQSAATNTGDRSAATNTGNRSAATNTGYQSAATNTGNRSAATVEGKESVAISLGIESKAKGAFGCWLVLAEWECGDELHRKDVQCVIVDGEIIKADTFYILKDGRFTEV